MKRPLKLTKKIYNEALRELILRDADLLRIYKTHGAPPTWQREEGFHTLVHIILEQQVSLASAKAAFDKLSKTISVVNPENFLTLDDATLKQIGFSRQKTLYCRLLAEEIAEEKLDLKALAKMHDAEVRERLKRLKGIGDWTVDIYLLMSLMRPDAYPKGDLALAIAVHEVKKLKSRPTPEQLEEISKPWQPFRAVATRIFWQHYLSTR